MLYTNRLFLIGFSLIIACTNPDRGAPDQNDNRPNVILIMTDDQGYGDLACHRNPHISTPNLDKLYNQSVRLTNFHVGTTCSPTRAALMTGKYGNRVGVWHTIGGRSQLARGHATMGDVFSNNGYRTGMFGKWHLGDSYPFRPQDRGFDDVLYHGGGGVWQGPDYWDNDYFDDTYFTADGVKKTSGYCTDVWFDETIDFIKENKETPFFAYLATNAPHGPFHVDSSYIRPYIDLEGVNPNFNGMITNFDDNMGKLMTALDELGLAQNTILIYMTDNGTARGASFDELGRIKRGYNAGMRGIKGSEYEGGHRVPCFIRWPQSDWVHGRDIEVLTAHIDLLPTLITSCSLQEVQTDDLDGKDLASLFEGQTENIRTLEDRILVTDTQRDEFLEKWKRSSTMKGSWRVIKGTELYELESDPGQQNDLATEQAELLATLKVGYEEWWNHISESKDNYTRAVISGNGLVLYAHDWHETYDAEGQSTAAPWNQTAIRRGPLKNGHWTVEVSEAGDYDIKLRRWPKEIDHPITEGLPMKKAVPGGRDLPEGRAIGIKSARINIGEVDMSSEVSPGASEVSFRSNLTEGPYNLQTWFEGDNGLSLGAYYVYIEKVL